MIRILGRDVFIVATAAVLAAAGAGGCGSLGDGRAASCGVPALDVPAQTARAERYDEPADGRRLAAPEDQPDSPSPWSAADPSVRPGYASAAGPHAAGGIRVSAEGSYLFGSVRGSVQTPSGGRPGTTSPDRPSFKEIGIDDASIADVALTIGTPGGHEFYAGGQLIGLSGSATLRDTLVSQGRTFDAGTRVQSDVRLDWYRIGYQHPFVLARGEGERPELTLTPAAGAGLFTFDYKLRTDAADGPRVSRSYSKLMPQVGLEAEWRPGGGPFAVSAGAFGFPRIGTATPRITAEHVLVHYHAVEGHLFTADVFGGVAFEQMNFEDGQTVPNHVRADFGPLLVVGLKLDF